MSNCILSTYIFFIIGSMWQVETCTSGSGIYHLSWTVSSNVCHHLLINFILTMIFRSNTLPFVIIDDMLLKTAHSEILAAGYTLSTVTKKKEEENQGEAVVLVQYKGILHMCINVLSFR